MHSAGKLFAIAAMAALVGSVVRWPWQGTGYHVIKLKEGLYSIGPDYWAVSIGAVFALFAALYHWFPILFSFSLSSRMSLLHFSLSAVAAIAFLVIGPWFQAVSSGRLRDLSTDHAMIIAPVAAILFLAAQLIFLANVILGAFFAKYSD